MKVELAVLLLGTASNLLFLFYSYLSNFIFLHKGGLTLDEPWPTRCLFSNTHPLAVQSTLPLRSTQLTGKRNEDDDRTSVIGIARVGTDHESEAEREHSQVGLLAVDRYFLSPQMVKRPGLANLGSFCDRSIYCFS